MLRLALAFLFVLVLSPLAQAEPLRIAVAANFRVAMADIAKSFQEASGTEVQYSTGSTGQLVAQIIHGAPFDVFLAADQTGPARLMEEGHAVEGSALTYANGRLALLAPGHEVPGDGTIPDLGDLDRVSIANPRTAPYGVAAMEVLDNLDIAGVELVLAQNAGGVVAAVASGAAPVGLTSLSLARSTDRVPAWTVPQDLHEPLAQDAILLTLAAEKETAREFMAWLSGESARRIIKAHGYSLD